MDITPQLHAAWISRYDAYGDLLYAHLLDLFQSRRDVIVADLIAAMLRATSPKERELPIWEFTAWYSKQPEQDPVHDTRIGTTALGVRALPFVSVYTILAHTDVLARLAAAFGPDLYVYHRHKETLCETDQGVQTRRELVLAYYPTGLPPHLAAPIHAASERQAQRTPYTPTWVERRCVAEPLETPPSSPPSSPPRMIPRRRCSCEHEC